MRRIAAIIAGGCLALTAAGPALACGGLVAPNGSVNLLRTTTLAAYHDGVEHYVTSFEFTGAGGGKFGSLVPLPGVPSKVQRGGRWTLQRLVQEIQPVFLNQAAADTSSLRSSAKYAQVLLEKRISGLDITILKGGGDAVGNWARKNGFNLPPDAPEVLDFYAERSPIFMAARFNVERAEDKDLSAGDGVPIHLSIPTEDPWVPLRILGLGRGAEERIEADVFLLTDQAPRVLPAAAPAGSDTGMVLERSEPASEFLLSDLRSDRGMDWLPAKDMWLSYLRIDEAAGALDHDLAITVDGSTPSAVDAGLVDRAPRLPGFPGDPVNVVPWLVAALMAGAVITVTSRFADGIK